LDAGLHTLRRHWRLSWVTAIVCFVVVVAGVAAASVVRLESSQSRSVLKGVTVGGISIGGMEFTKAHTLLLNKFDKPLDSPVSIQVPESKPVTTTWRELGSSTDVEKVFEQATDLRSKISLAQRLWLRISGGSVSRNLDVKATFDSHRAEAFVARIAKSVHKEPRNARVALVGGVPKVIPEASGLALDETKAIDTIKKASVSHDHKMAFSSNQVPAAVTKADLKDVLVVKVGDNELDHYRGDQLVKIYKVATGLPKYPTPLGQFRIVNKRFLPTWVNPAKVKGEWGEKLPASIGPGPGNPLGTRAMDLNSPGIRIHGTTSTPSLGFNASHGCIRMAMPDVEELFSQVGVGTPVFILRSGPDRLSTQPVPTNTVESLVEAHDLGTPVPAPSAPVVPTVPAVPSPEPTQTEKPGDIQGPKLGPDGIPLG
jgi:lipoprotein-anchoring transpeptidase ErfK/SrfK